MPYFSYSFYGPYWYRVQAYNVPWSIVLIEHGFVSYINLIFFVNSSSLDRSLHFFYILIFTSSIRDSPYTVYIHLLGEYIFWRRFLSSPTYVYLSIDCCLHIISKSWGLESFRLATDYNLGDGKTYFLFIYFLLEKSILSNITFLLFFYIPFLSIFNILSYLYLFLIVFSFFKIN